MTTDIVIRDAAQVPELISTARQALAAASGDLGSLADVRDKLHFLEVAFRTFGASLEARTEAGELRLRSEVEMGGLLTEMPHRGREASPEYRDALQAIGEWWSPGDTPAQAGVSRSEQASQAAQEWQRMYRLSQGENGEDVLGEYVRVVRDSDDENAVPTRKGFLRFLSSPDGTTTRDGGGPSLMERLSRAVLACLQNDGAMAAELEAIRASTDSPEGFRSLPGDLEELAESIRRRLQ